MHPDDWFFVRATDGGRLRDIEERVRRTYQNAGLEPQGLHVLRRTWATGLAESGVNAEVIHRMGGWSSLDIVQQSYFGVGEETMREAIARVVINDNYFCREEEVVDVDQVG
jgi:integrase